MEAIRQVVHRDKLNRIIPIPESFGPNVEVIILPTSRDHEESLSENERFLAAAYHAVIEDDAEEDRIWEKYV